MKLSIVVTAFNEEKYIHRCLDSLAKQKTNFDYEVIIVNDGSTDHTQDVIDQYVANFGNIFSSFCKKNIVDRGFQEILVYNNHQEITLDTQMQMTGLNQSSLSKCVYQRKKTMLM
ncbi:glycosyltransferase family 2 protein [Pediococcus pentosaceus]|uniref:glycosyltransferase family 2 protein n=1 Tax=Pediococcus pentosaceus TaxID=1255 RepID=UPI0018E158A1|nr:glycosyltransferase family 2 protein [Pediococcus pentosaceus]MBF7103868.1 glycosyltransferase family 2 protein [Pediococcus pentosaceus]QQC62099.1 glycosyltransferase family 2 protein [Pediococcus pentosaceus]